MNSKKINKFHYQQKLKKNYGIPSEGAFTKRTMYMLAFHEHNFNNMLMKNTEKKINYWRQIDPQEIISLHAESNYTTLLLKNGKSLMVSICLKELEKRLSKNGNTHYLRVSRSVLVNVQFIADANYNLGNSHIILTNNEEVPISRRKRLQIKSKMKQLSMAIPR